MLCLSSYTCGTQCLPDFNHACVNNQTLCKGFYYWNENVNLCGSQQQCYDNTTTVCLGTNGTICPIGSQLCSGICYNPQVQYCISGSNTIFCLDNPSLTECPTNPTTSTSLASYITSIAQVTPTTTGISTTTLLSATTTKANTTTTRSTTTASPPVPYCLVRSCTSNSDCCQHGTVECQCYRHNQTDVYGLCLNPHISSPCTDSCPVTGRCKIDSDCCGCQCAMVTFTDSSGDKVTKKQCAQR